MGGSVRRRRRLVKRLRKEIRSARRWTTVALAIWGYFKLTENRPPTDEPPTA